MWWAEWSASPEAQVLAWITPWLWAFFRVAGIFTTAPVLSQRAFRAGCVWRWPFHRDLCAAQPAAHAGHAINSPQAVMVIIQQVLIGLTMGFAARVVFAAIEFAGEIIGLQMGLSFASFFDPMMGGQANGASRFLGTTALWLFVVMNGHLLLTGAVLQSFHAFPVSPEPLAFLDQVQPQVWGAEIFKLGLWVALPVVSDAAAGQHGAGADCPGVTPDERVHHRLSDHPDGWLHRFVAELCP